MTSQPLRQLLYWSRSTGPMGSFELDQLLKSANRKNVSCNVTGFLLFDTSIFIQLLEGPKQSVLDTFSRIQKDPRHKSLLTLHEADADARAFPMWSMAYHLVDEGRLVVRGGSFSFYTLKGLVLLLQKKEGEMAHAMARYLSTFLDIQSKAAAQGV